MDGWGGGQEGCSCRRAPALTPPPHPKAHSRTRGRCGQRPHAPLRTTHAHMMGVCQSFSNPIIRNNSSRAQSIDPSGRVTNHRGSSSLSESEVAAPRSLRKHGQACNEQLGWAHTHRGIGGHHRWRTATEDPQLQELSNAQLGRAGTVQVGCFSPSTSQCLSAPEPAAVSCASMPSSAATTSVKVGRWCGLRSRHASISARQRGSQSEATAGWRVPWVTPAVQCESKGGPQLETH